MKKILTIAPYFIGQFVFSQQLSAAQFNAGSHQSAQSAYIIGEAFNNEYQFTGGSLAESILAGAAPSVLAVANPTRNLLKIYPNPVAQERFFVNSPVSTRGYLYDAAGRMVKTLSLKHGKNTVEVFGLASGVYLFKMENGFTAKIIIP